MNQLRISLQELKEAISECQTAARMAVLEGNHRIGGFTYDLYLLLEKKHALKTVAEYVSKRVNRSIKQVMDYVAFYRAYPDLSLLPKNASYTRILKELKEKK